MPKKRVIRSIDLPYSPMTPVIVTSGGGAAVGDADTLDGLDSTDFALTSHTHTHTGVTDFDEAAQDAVASILTDSSTIDFTYTDATPSIVAAVSNNSITNNKLSLMAAASVKGRAVGAGTGDPVDLSANGLNAIVGTDDIIFSALKLIRIDKIQGRNGGGLSLQDASGNVGALVTSGGGIILYTPTIADFTNAQHDHLDADDGGQLTTAALSNYVEGTWTPAITGATTNPTVTYTTQVGKYTRIGNTVNWAFRIQLSAYTAASGSGGLRISLPFTANADGSTYGVRIANFTTTGTPVTVIFSVSNGNAYGNVRSCVSAGGGTVEPVTNLSNTTIIESSGVMFI